MIHSGFDPCRSAEPTRRDLLRLSLSALAIVSGAGTLTTLAGCGGGGGEERASTTRAVTGQLRTAEIGGAGHRILSARAAMPASANTTGSFSTDVAAENAQMLIVTDNSGAARAMALSLPGEPPAIGAESTALALAFLTPGIMASDPDLARAAVARIRAQAKWTELVAAVRTELPRTGLAGLKTTAIVALVESIVTGFQAADQGRGTTSVNPAILFKGAWGKAIAANKQGVTLTHEGFRYVRIDVQRLNSSGERLTHEVAADVAKPLTAMEPAGLASIGSLLVALRTGAKNSPAERTAVVQLDQPVGTGRLKFYVSGIGLGPNSETAPFTLGKAEMKESYWKSVFFILIMPFLDVLLGGLGAKGISSVNFDRLNNMYAALGARLSIDSVYDAVQSNDWASISAAMIDYLSAALGFLTAIVETYGIAGLSSPVLLAIASVAGAAGLGIAAGNLGVIHLFLNRAPRTQSIELQVAEVEGTIK